jgi:hypothetical protein
MQLHVFFGFAHKEETFFRLIIYLFDYASV